MATITYTGLKEFNEFEKSAVKSIIESRIDKIERKFTPVTLAVMCKKYSATGKSHKFSFHARISKGSFLVASHAFDWEIERAVHRTMDKLLAELQHRYKTEGKRVRTSPEVKPRRKAR